MSNLKENIKAAQIDLIKELGIDKLEPVQKEKLLTQIGDILQQRVVLRIVEELPEEKQDDFNAILEKAQDDPTLLDKFLEENIPGVEDMILEEIGEYKKGATDFMKQTLKNAGVEEAQGAEPVVEEVIKEETKKETTEIIEKDLEKKSEIETEPAEAKEALVEKVEPEVSEEAKIEPKIEIEKAPEELKEVVEPVVEEKEIILEKTEEVEPEKTESAELTPEIELVAEEKEVVLEKEAKIEVKETISEVEVEPVVEKKKETEREIPVAPGLGLAPIVEKKEEIATEAPVKTGFEKEQAEQEAQILEENKVENAQVAGEELDLSNEIEEMTPVENEENKQ